jgi:hypothetical protein
MYSYNDLVASAFLKYLAQRNGAWTTINHFYLLLFATSVCKRALWAEKNEKPQLL